MYIYKFEPYLKSVIWGGDKIKKLKGIVSDQENIGESWELSGVAGHESVVLNGPDAGKTLTQLIDKYKDMLVGKEVYDRFGTTFPLLVKIIDANKDLSVQVHPNDQLARKRHNSLGKTEMWYIMHADDDASIYAGLTQQITPDDYTRLVADNKIMDVVAKHKSQDGDVYYLPAGRIHAIGAGNLLAEIQETSDITYRIYDYNRRDADGNLRELHTELAKDAIDYTVYPDYKGFHEAMRAVDGSTPLVQCRYFNTYKIELEGNSVIKGVESFTIVMCLDGNCTLSIADAQTEHLQAGTTALVPANTDINISGKASLLYINIVG